MASFLRQEEGAIVFQSLQPTLAGSADTEMNESSIVQACGTDVGGDYSQRQNFSVSTTRELSQRNSSHIQINSFLSNMTPFHSQGVALVSFTVMKIMGGAGMGLAPDNDSDAEITLKSIATQGFALVSCKWPLPYLSSTET